MKAVWLLFCLGLAHGSIFRRHYFPQMERFGPQVSIEYQRENPQVVRNSVVANPTADVNDRWTKQYDQSNLEQLRYVNGEYYPSPQYVDEQQVASSNKQHSTKQATRFNQAPRLNQDATLSQDSTSNQVSSSSEQDSEQFRHANREYYPIPRYADQQQVKNRNKKHVMKTQTSKSKDQDLEQFRYVNGEYYAIPRYADQQQERSFSLMAQQLPKHTEAYGDAVEWRSIKIAVGPDSKILKKDIEKIYYDAQKTMKHPSEEMRQKYHEMYENVKSEDASLNATELLKKYQYPVEEHIVRTDDGYDLTLFRIVKQTQQTKEATQRPVVLLMHSMLGSADDWLLMGPSQSLAYLLADQGYDVWLGNVRGSRYSRSHVSHHPAQNDFWTYSNDEIALHDLPAMIDYALTTSAQQKLFYVGYDLGTTAFFALASTRPEYNNKVVMMYALSPMAYMSHVRSPLVKMIAPNSPFYENLNQNLKDGEFKPSKELVSMMGGEMLKNEIGCKKIASNVNFVMSGMNVENMDVKLIRVIMGHLPAGASTRQVKQYGQAAATHDFRMFDYGAEINEEVYGKQVPPTYDVTKISAPVALYFSEGDWLAHPKDVLQLKEQLPNVTEYYQVPEEYFSHMDFLYSQKAPAVVYNKLIESIKNNIHKN